MVDNISKATPYVYLRGPKSVNGQGVQRIAERIPMHCPIQVVLAERGRSEPVWIAGNAVQTWGSKTFDRNGPFWNHSNFMAELLSEQSNMFLGIRAKPANAKNAMSRLSVEVIVADIPVYERAADGSIVNNNSVPVIKETIIGSRVITHTGVSHYQEAERGFGKGKIVENFRDGATVINGRTLGEVTINGTKVTTKSRLLPIHDLEVDSFGGYGNNVGVSYGTPSSTDPQAIDTQAVLKNKAFFYRLACWERESASTTPVVQQTQAQANAVDLTFKENTKYPVNGKVASISRRFIPSYQLLNDPQFPNEYGPFGRSHIYTDNIAQLLTMLTSGYTYTTTAGDVTVLGEKAYDTVAEEYGRLEDTFFSDPKNVHLFNFLTGQDYNGVPYFAVDGRSSQLYGGVSLANDAVVYATGGSDGLWYQADGSPASLINLRMFDIAARAIFKNGDALYGLGDRLRYPISAVWDSGWSMDTKLAMIDMLGLRPDIGVYTGTQSVIDDYKLVATGTPEPVYLDGVMSQAATDVNELIGGWGWAEVNDDTTELARGNQLRARYNLFPSSTYHSTPTAFGAIYGHGERYYNEDLYDGILPFTFDRLVAAAKFAGGSAWVRGARPNIYPNNVVTQFLTAKGTYRNLPTMNKFWDAGINWVQFVDTKGLFYPAQQSVFPNDTSPMNGIVTIYAELYCQRAWTNVWKYLTGRDDLTDDQMIQESDKLMLAELDGVFDDGITYTVTSEILASDKAAGHIWRGRVDIYSNTPKSVAIFDIYSHNRSDLEAAGIVVT